MKKIVKILTLSVLAAALFVGCSKQTDTPTETPTNTDSNNGGSDTPVTTPADDENKDNNGADKEGDDKDKSPEYTDVGFLKLDGWGNYDLSDKTENSVTVSYSGKSPKQYDTCCGGEITFGATKKVTLTVKNNDSKSAYVKVDVKNDAKGSAVTAATVNGNSVDVQWGGADTTLEANATADFVLTINPEVGADKFIIALNNNQTENPDSGSITISKAYKYE